MKCQNCGTSFEGNFCPKCGTKAASVSTSSRHKKDKPIVLIIVLVLVLAGGVLSGFFLKGHLAQQDRQTIIEIPQTASNSSQPANSTATPTATTTPSPTPESIPFPSAAPDVTLEPEEPFDPKWYVTERFYQDSLTGIILDISYLDYGFLQIEVDGVVQYSCWDDLYTKGDAGDYIYTDENAQMEMHYFPKDHSISLIENGITTTFELYEYDENWHQDYAGYSSFEYNISESGEGIRTLHIEYYDTMVFVVTANLGTSAYRCKSIDPDVCKGGALLYYAEGTMQDPNTYEILYYPSDKHVEIKGISLEDTQYFYSPEQLVGEYPDSTDDTQWFLDYKYYENTETGETMEIVPIALSSNGYEEDCFVIGTEFGNGNLNAYVLNTMRIGDAGEYIYKSHNSELIYFPDNHNIAYCYNGETTVFTLSSFTPNWFEGAVYREKDGSRLFLEVDRQDDYLNFTMSGTGGVMVFSAWEPLLSVEVGGAAIYEATSVYDDEFALITYYSGENYVHIETDTGSFTFYPSEKQPLP